MTFVFDATPLIYLGKVDGLDVLEEFQREILVPGRVYEEVVNKGLEKGYADARRVNKFIRNGGLERRSIEETERFTRIAGETELSLADTAVLLLADEVDGTAVMDESYGRNIANTENIQVRGTAYLLLSLVKRGQLGAGEVRDTIDSMLDAGWHCSPNLYAKILRKLESLPPE